MEFFADCASETMENGKGSHLHTSSVCTWCWDQNVIKGSRTEMQDSQRIKNEITR